MLLVLKARRPKVAALHIVYILVILVYPGREVRLLRVVTSSESEHKDMITKYPDAAYVMKQGQEELGKVVNLASCAPVGVGESKDWVRIVHGAKQDRSHLYRVLHHCGPSGQNRN